MSTRQTRLRYFFGFNSVVAKGFPVSLMTLLTTIISKCEQPTCSFIQIAAACIQSQSLFSAQRETKVLQPPSVVIQQMALSQNVNSLLTPDVIFIRNMFMFRNTAAWTFSVHQNSNPHPFNIHTCRNYETEVLQSASIFSYPLFRFYGSGARFKPMRLLLMTKYLYVAPTPVGWHV